MSSYRAELDRFLAELDVKAETVIDIGGAQRPVKGRTKSWEVERYVIADLESPHADTLQAEVIFNIERDNWASGRPVADVAFCLEVFDYLILPDFALENIRHMLKIGGTAYVSFPFIYPTHNPVEHEGLRYTERAIRRLADMVRLQIVELIPRRPDSNLLQQFYAAEGMRAAKGYDHAVTGWIAVIRRTI